MRGLHRTCGYNRVDGCPSWPQRNRCQPVDTTTLVGVAPDYLVSRCAQALVGGDYFPGAIRSLLEDRTGATSSKTKITLKQSDKLVQDLAYRQLEIGKGQFPRTGLRRHWKRSSL